MYSKEKVKPFRDENHKPKKTHRNTPSFSSTLLDEIYNSIEDDHKVFDEKPQRKQGVFRAKSRSSSSVGDEEMLSFPTRGCLVEKAAPARIRTSAFFSGSTNSSSSDNSSGGLSSCFLFDDHGQRKNKTDGDDVIKSKSTMYKIYANLKKVKQPISPGGRLTSFINSLFASSHEKKSKKVDNDKVLDQNSSTSRPCLSKNVKSREETRDGIQRAVRFNPVGVIVDHDSRPPLPPNALEDMKMRIREKIRMIEEAAKDVVKSCQNRRNNDLSVFRGVDDDDDDFSDSSSDLFELDHLALFGKKRFCDQELPVYETTYLF